MDVLKKTLSNFRKTNPKVEDLVIIHDMFDYERTVYRCILPRILGKIDVERKAYRESWFFIDAPYNRLNVLQMMIDKAIREITTDDNYDVKIVGNSLDIWVDKASEFSRMRITEYKRSRNMK